MADWLQTLLRSVGMGSDEDFYTGINRLERSLGTVNTEKSVVRKENQPRTEDLWLSSPGVPKPATMRAKNLMDTVREVVSGDYLANKAEDYIGSGPIPEVIRMLTPDPTDLVGGPVAGMAKPVKEIVDRGLFKSRLAEHLGKLHGKTRPTPVEDVQRLLKGQNAAEVKAAGLDEFTRKPKKGTVWPEELLETADENLPRFEDKIVSSYDTYRYINPEAGAYSSVAPATLVHARAPKFEGSDIAKPTGAGRHFREAPDYFTRTQLLVTPDSRQFTSMLEGQTDVAFKFPNSDDPLPHVLDMPRDAKSYAHMEQALKAEHDRIIRRVGAHDRLSRALSARGAQQFVAETANPQLQAYYRHYLTSPRTGWQDTPQMRMLDALEDLSSMGSGIADASRETIRYRDTVNAIANRGTREPRHHVLEDLLARQDKVGRAIDELKQQQLFSHHGSLSPTDHMQMSLKTFLQKAAQNDTPEALITPGELINESLGNTVMRRYPDFSLVDQFGDTQYLGLDEDNMLEFLPNSRVPNSVQTVQFQNAVPVRNTFDMFEDPMLSRLTQRARKDAITLRELLGGKGNPAFYGSRYPDLLSKILKEHGIAHRKTKPITLQSMLDSNRYLARPFAMDPIAEFLARDKFYAW